jgi:hypothetical protein
MDLDGMSFPDYFAQIPGVTLHDTLAELLGAPPDGLLDYRFEDAVRLAGHACPTIAGAWLMARRGLAALHPESIPERGALRVEMRANLESGTAGVVGSIFGLLTGASGAGGFKGLGGRFSRRDLLVFGVEQPAEIRLTRLDSGATALLDYYPERVPPAPEVPALLSRLLGGSADDEERRQFRIVWQDRLRRILLEHGEDPDLVSVRLA